jgi:hypothetical protein
METFEAPAIKLSGERFELAMCEEFGHHLTNEKFFFVDLPCPAMWLRNGCEDVSCLIR